MHAVTLLGCLKWTDRVLQQASSLPRNCHMGLPEGNPLRDFEAYTDLNAVCTLEAGPRLRAT